MKFSQKCYQLLKQVPKGKVTTYQSIAKALKSKAFRAVGTAMKNNPNAPIVPCHRVINSNGNIGNYNLGQDKKIQLLRKEEIEINNNKIVNIQTYIYNFNK